MGRGLFRLYLALWLLWFSYGVADNYKELATYIGYDYWTVERANERNKILCSLKPDECLPEWLDSADTVSEDSVNVVVWMFTMAMINAPFYFLVFLITMYWLVKWAVAGFRRKKNAKT